MGPAFRGPYFIFGTHSYASLKSILQNNLEAQPLVQELPLPSPAHDNLRGGPYYA